VAERSLSQQILDAAVAGIEGSERPGQDAMAAAIDHAFASGEHLLVQAGTGTGKSLGYLAPSLAYVSSNRHQRVVIATATLALQAQLAHTDIPAAVTAAEKVTGRRITHAILKGRTNYACLHRVIEGAGAEQDSLLGGAEMATELRRSRADAGVCAGRRGPRPARMGPRGTGRGGRR
jgi:ATP-dependent DNA helicase DinG